MNKFLVFITLIFSVSILAEEVDPSKLPAAVKKALNRFLPKADPDKCSWSLWSERYSGKCKLVEGDESSPDVLFEVGKNGQKPSAKYELKSTEFSGHIDQKMVKAAGKVFTSLLQSETEPDSAMVELETNGKVHAYYLFYTEGENSRLVVAFNGAGKQIGKLLRVGRRGY